MTAPINSPLGDDEKSSQYIKTGGFTIGLAQVLVNGEQALVYYDNVPQKIRTFMTIITITIQLFSQDVAGERYFPAINDLQIVITCGQLANRIQARYLHLKMCGLMLCCSTFHLQANRMLTSRVFVNGRARF